MVSIQLYRETNQTKTRIHFSNPDQTDRQGKTVGQRPHQATDKSTHFTEKKEEVVV